MSSRADSAAVRSRVPRLAEAAVERARLTVVPRARTKAAKVPFVSLVTLLLVGGVVGLLLFNTSMQQSSFTATSLEERATVLSARQEALAMQLERLRDPQVVAGKAQQLGMRVPAAPLFLDLADGSVEGDRAGASLTAPVVLQAPPQPRPAALVPETRVVRPPEGTLSDGRGDQRGDRDRGRDEGRNGREDRQDEKQDQNKQDKQNKQDEKKQKNQRRR